MLGTVDPQKKALRKRANDLCKDLDNKLKDATTHDDMTDAIKEYVVSVSAELGGYARRVQTSYPNPNPRKPGAPCPEGEIWCPTKMECTKPEDCPDVLRE